MAKGALTAGGSDDVSPVPRLGRSAALAEPEEVAEPPGVGAATGVAAAVSVTLPPFAASVTELLDVLHQGGLLPPDSALARTLILEAILDAVNAPGGMAPTTVSPADAVQPVVRRIGMVNGRFAYVEPVDLSADAVAAMAGFLGEARDAPVAGVVCDLRASADGTCDAAESFAALLAGTERPVAVLIGRGTKGAAEHFIRQLQALADSVLTVGQPTAGFPCAWRTVTMSDGLRLRVPETRDASAERRWDRVPITADIVVETPGAGEGSKAEAAPVPTSPPSTAADATLRRAVDMLIIINALDKRIAEAPP